MRGERKRARTFKRRNGRKRGRFQQQFRGRRAPAVGELKFHDIDVDDATIAAGGTIQNTGSINLIAQGVTESTRVGRKCVIRSIGWRYTLEKVSTTTLTSGDETVRVIMYLDKQCNGATAAVTDILDTDDYHSFNNLGNSGRFRTLLDRTHTLNNPSLTVLAGPNYAYGTTSVERSFFKKVEIPLEFSSTVGAITEIRSNNIGVLLLSKTGSLVNFNSTIRLRFSDS